MRHYECECLNCHSKQQLAFKEQYPEYGDHFTRFCKFCDKESSFTRVLTRKAQADLRRKQAEADLKSGICDYCKNYGFKCRFYLESVIITTPASMWSFNYHDKEKELRHENRRLIRDDMGGYVKTHEQFRRQMNWKEVIDYIYRHDQWRLQKSTAGEKSMSDPKTEQKATEWTDGIRDPGDEHPEPYEETYQDGSAKNECWAEE